MSSIDNDTQRTRNAQGDTMKIKVEFTGGLELLFANQTIYTLSLPSTISTSSSRSERTSRPYTIADLITHLVTHVMKDSRRELFVLDSSPSPSSSSLPPTMKKHGEENGDETKYTIRPGILVLINDADWELEGEDKYELRDGDGVLFVSTLHGG